MTSLRSRLERLELEAAGLYETLHLPDGTGMLYTGEEMLDALSAAIRHEEHRLLPHVRQVDTNEGMPGLIRALEESRRGERDENA